MDLGLGTAGLICVGLAIGHATIGLRWVLPSLTSERLPSTRCGPASTTVTMVRVTWHVVTVFCLTFGAMLLALASSADVDPRTLLLRSTAAMWLAATAMACWVAPLRRDNLRSAVRLPVPLFWVVVAILCWEASR